MLGLCFLVGRRFPFIDGMCRGAGAQQLFPSFSGGEDSAWHGASLQVSVCAVVNN
jgi:hypothetical protein